MAQAMIAKLFVARNTALAFFVCKWLVYASQASTDRIVDRIHVLVAPFEDGPRRVRVEAAGARRRLALGSAGRKTSMRSSWWTRRIISRAIRGCARSSLD